MKYIWPIISIGLFVVGWIILFYDIIKVICNGSLESTIFNYCMDISKDYGIAVAGPIIWMLPIILGTASVMATLLYKRYKSEKTIQISFHNKKERG